MQAFFDAVYNLVGDAGVFVILSVLLGGLGKPLVDAIKGWLGWEDKKALALSFAVAVVLAVLHAFVVGILKWGDFTVESVIAAIGSIYATANILYRWFKTGEQPGDIEGDGS